MPAPSTLPLFIVTSIVLLVIPGPAVLFIVTRSASQGRRAGLVSVLGVHCASVVHVLAAVAGLSALVVASALAFTTVKIVGAAYLIGLGLHSLVRARRTGEMTEPVPQPARRMFVDGFTVNLLNPKVALFFLAFLPQFVDPRRGPVWSQTLALGLVYIALGLMSDGTYAAVAARVGSWLTLRRSAPRRGRFAEGGLLIGLGVVALAVPHRRTTK